MALTLEQKKTVVAEVAQEAAVATALMGAEYRGLTANEMASLQKNARDKGVYLRVVPNRLAKRALEETEFTCVQDGLTGPLILAFSKEEPSASARLFKDFSKEHDKLIVKIVALSGQLLDASDLEAVAKLPTREEAIAQLMAVMQAPIVKLARTMAEVPGKFVRTMAAVRDQK